ncbi:transposase (plasmid) [Paraburkholderia kururiensis]|uniref:DUF6904 family protein n=1 Tax=Paraburkholderia kururiensis TaxID=984307 RepID=UPI0039A59A68
MLQFDLTKRHAGIVLWGDTWSLRAVHDLVHKVNEESPVVQNKEGFLLGLAYDVRKAYEGQREKAVREYFEDRCPIYGVQILWPVVIAQVALLRAGMAFIPTDRMDQSVMYELEHLVDRAVREATPAGADEILEQMKRLGEAHAHVETVIDSRCGYFVSLPPKQRVTQLAMLLASLDSMYGFRVELARRNGAEGVISLDSFEPYAAGAEWPDFQW